MNSELSHWEGQYNVGCCCAQCIRYEKEMIKEHDWDANSKVALSVPTSRMVDFEADAEPPKVELSHEDVELCKLFLGRIKDETLSRSTHKVLTDLIGRLP